MPSLGADMTAGRLLSWRRKAGDTVQRGDIIAEVDTDKGVIEVEVFTGGTIERLLVPPGTRVPVGTPLAIIREAGAPAEGPPPTAPPRVRISPLAAKVAAELGVDPATVTGTGPGGAITREDVERAAAAAPGPPVPATAEERDARMREAIAAAVTRSKREIPHYYVGQTIDLGPAMAWLEEQNRSRAVADRLLANALLLKAVALTLREFPELNARWVEGKPVRSAAVHLGVAIALRQGGLIAPALPDADRQSIVALMRNLLDLVNRARAGGLRASELSAPTITVTSLGDRGSDRLFGVIYPPQVAIVGFGRVTVRPWVVDGQVAPRPLVEATLAADHRVSDGHRGGLFLAALAERLREPGRL
jgi:pyruvate dehydrogenase E2 component (dihydrolipoamide acetyltransferase)